MRDRILPQLFHRIILASRDYKRVSINNKACQLLLRQIAVQSVASSIKRLAFLERDALDYTYIRSLLWIMYREFRNNNSRRVWWISV